MTVKTNIASGLKAARKAAGMSVDEVGAALGKSGKTIYAWEVGRGQPDGDELIKLCELLNVHLKDFYGSEYEALVTDSITAPDLSPDEHELVDLYRGTADFGRRAVMSLAREYREHMPREADYSGHLALYADMTDEEVEAELERYGEATGDSRETDARAAGGLADMAAKVSMEALSDGAIARRVMGEADAKGRAR